MVEKGTHDKSQVIEEPDEVKVSRPVLKTNGVGDSLVEFNQFSVDVECVDIQPKTGKEIGLDVGLESFYTDSNGHQEANPKFLRKAEPAIKHAQRRIYKKKKGSNNRRQARARYSKKHLRLTSSPSLHERGFQRLLFVFPLSLSRLT